jgi:hypothetical protein
MNAAAATETLLEAAARLGFTLSPSKFEGFKDWFDADDEFVGSFDAADGWAYVHELEAA